MSNSRLLHCPSDANFQKKQNGNAAIRLEELAKSHSSPSIAATTADLYLAKAA
jgi:hypothetical protein